MKVTRENSIKYKVLQRIKRKQTPVILRADIDDLAEPRQISRALKSLVEEKILVKLGYGVYGKLTPSKYGEPYLSEGFIASGRIALTRLKVKWEPSEAERAYNKRLSTQVPANPATRL